MNQQPGYWHPVNDGNGNREGVSKQFQPKKYKEGNETWRMEKKEGSGQQLLSYTPFKSSTLGRTNTPTENIPHNGTLKPVNKNPFVFPQQQILCDPPQSHSTPKATHHQNIRPESANYMIKDQKLTWGRLPSQPAFRSVSAMGQSMTMGRPSSRQSEADIGHCVGSRYHSYCTLPRPEEIDPETLSEMHSNLHSYYGKAPPKVVSRPPSTIPMVPGMASDYVQPPSTFIPPTIPMGPHPRNDREIVNWNTLSLVCSMQVLCALGVFGLGVGRMMQGAKWAIGIELAYAVCVMIASLAGIYAVRRRSYAASCLSYMITAFTILLAIPPFVIGLFPTIPWTFTEAIPATWMNENEPLELDFGLSLVILIQVLLSLIIVVAACRSFEVISTTLEDIKLQYDLQQAFHDHGEIPHKA